MDLGYNIGDRVMQIEDRVVGKVIRFYKPTACAQQTMIICDDGRKYHAPSATFIKTDNLALPVAAPLLQSAAQPLIIKHNYRNIKVGENTTVTIDVEELKRQMLEDRYKSMGIGLNYGA